MTNQRTIHKTLRDQLLARGVESFTEKVRLYRTPVSFLWKMKKLCVIINKPSRVSISSIPDDYTVYEVSPNQVKSGDAVQMIETLLLAKKREYDKWLVETAVIEDEKRNNSSAIDLHKG